MFLAFECLSSIPNSHSHFGFYSDLLLCSDLRKELIRSISKAFLGVVGALGTCPEAFWWSLGCPGPIFWIWTGGPQNCNFLLQFAFKSDLKPVLVTLGPFRLSSGKYEILDMIKRRLMNMRNVNRKSDALFGRTRQIDWLVRWSWLRHRRF